jgi:hypothetical protein
VDGHQVSLRIKSGMQKKSFKNSKLSTDSNLQPFPVRPISTHFDNGNILTSGPNGINCRLGICAYPFLIYSSSASSSHHIPSHSTHRPKIRRTPKRPPRRLRLIPIQPLQPPLNPRILKSNTLQITHKQRIIRDIKPHYRRKKPNIRFCQILPKKIRPLRCIFL